MLRQRVITATILIPLTLAALFLLSGRTFAFLTAFVTLLAAWEWSVLMELGTTRARFNYLFLMTLMFFIFLFIPTPITFFCAFIWWLIAILLILLYPRGSEWWSSGMWRGIFGFLVLMPCWVAINFMRNAAYGIYILLFLFILVWGADTIAYFVGKKWGKHKLAPLISPGKSVEGLFGALLTSLLIALLGVKIFNMPVRMWPWFMILSLVTVLFSIVGDLFESMLKRKAKLKDSSQLLPGHGGLLDRIDSLTAAAPIFALGAILLGAYWG